MQKAVEENTWPCLLAFPHVYTCINTHAHATHRSSLFTRSCNKTVCKNWEVVDVYFKLLLKYYWKYFIFNTNFEILSTVEAATENISINKRQVLKVPMKCYLLLLNFILDLFYFIILRVWMSIRDQKRSWMPTWVLGTKLSSSAKSNRWKRLNPSSFLTTQNKPSA